MNNPSYLEVRPAPGTRQASPESTHLPELRGLSRVAVSLLGLAPRTHFSLALCRHSVAHRIEHQEGVRQWGRSVT